MTDGQIVLAIGGLFSILTLAAGIAYLLTLQRAISRCAPQNREVSPGAVWLNLIPLFNLVWQFILVARIAETLRREFQSRGGPRAAVPDDYGRGIGTAAGVLAISSLVPYLGFLTALAALVCWIVYWVKIAEYSRLLAWTGPYQAYPAESYPGIAAPYPPPEKTGAGEQVLVLLVLAFGYAANHLQRLFLSYTASMAMRDFHLSAQETGFLFSALAFGLLAGYVIMTAITALCGVRWGLVVSFAGMSLAAIASGAIQTFGGLLAARFALGFFSAGLLPAVVQSARDWFPARVRPLVIGAALAAGQAAGVVMPEVFRLWRLDAGWHLVSMASGVPTLIAAVLCLAMWPKPPAREPFREISAPAMASLGMLVAGLVFVWPIYTFATAWLSPYLYARRLGLLIQPLGVSAIELAGLLGSLFAGGIGWAIMESESGIARSRAILLTVFGCLLPAVALCPAANRPPVVIAAAAITALAYGGLSPLLYSAVADTFPARLVAIGAAIGVIPSAFLSVFGTPYILGFAERRGLPSLLRASAIAAAIGIAGVLALAWYLARREHGVDVMSPPRTG